MIPILWLSLHKKTPNRGYFDTGMLELLFEQKLFSPAYGYSYQNLEVNKIPSKTDGAVVVLPARYHVDDIDELNKQLAQLRWVLLILVGDEESLFPREKLKHPNMKLYVMTPRPAHDDKPADMYIGEGFPKDEPELLKTAKSEAMERPLDYWFSGQITHSRRKELVEQLEIVEEFKHNNHLKGEYNKTSGFTQGLAHPDYYKKMASAKAIPCPSGPMTPDSFRLFEALEAGCVPIADNKTPQETNAGVSDYWNYLFPDAPFPTLDNYENLQGELTAIRDNYPNLNNTVFAWWQRYKAMLARTVVNDIYKLSDIKADYTDQRKLITVIIPTSVIPAHPDTSMIEHTIADVRSQLPDSEIILAFDGVRKEQEDRADDYAEYIRRVLWLANHEWRNVIPIIYDEHQHQARMTRDVLKWVTTPLILFVEHDAPITPDREIEWLGLIDVMRSGEANVIRFCHEELILPDYDHMMLDKTNIQVGALKVPMRRTVQWSQRPHLASAVFYRNMIEQYFHPDSRTMIEDVMHGVVHNHFEREGDMAWLLYRIYIYTPMTDELGIKRSYHLDGRGDDPKYEMDIKELER